MALLVGQTWAYRRLRRRTRKLWSRPSHGFRRLSLHNECHSGQHEKVKSRIQLAGQVYSWYIPNLCAVYLACQVNLWRLCVFPYEALLFQLGESAKYWWQAQEHTIFEPALRCTDVREGDSNIADHVPESHDHVSKPLSFCIRGLALNPLNPFHSHFEHD